MAQIIEKIVKSAYPPKRTEILWLDAKDNSLKSFTSNGWVKITDYTNAQKVTYSQLKDLRDKEKLIPGYYYRITDYQCTTMQENTKSAGHKFDIIIRADSPSTLNEAASAIHHEGDTYFAGCNLSAWKIWYCLDNDNSRFAWADNTNGKGVIYRMIDEWNNDVPYDFKNIMYNGSWGYWAYTFNWINDESDNTCEDLSVSQYAHTNDEGGYSHTYCNIIKQYGGDDSGNYGYPYQLNACVFLHKASFDSGWFYGCNSNTFGDDCYSNTFGNGCFSNTFGNSCINNTFGDSCTNNTFGNNCSNNICGNSFSNNTFGNNCSDNTFGDGCSSNTFGDGCFNNTFGNNCSNTFGNGCSSNTFGDSCTNNTFGNNCSNNICGNSFSNNTFGNSCTNNTFGDSCTNNTFGNSCIAIKFALEALATTKCNYYKHNHFGDGCQYILFKGTGTASSSAQVQNYNFAQGLQGTSNAYLTIDGDRGRDYETKVGKNTRGYLEIYCDADITQ